MNPLLQGRIAAVLNTGSGSCDETSEGRMEAVLAAHGLEADLVVVGPRDVDRAMDRAAADADLVIVLGGDGTIRSAAERCGRAKKPLIPLPGGTMNMLPRAIYGDLGWEEALSATLAAPALKDISGAAANGEPFYCAAIVGAPSHWADAREAIREGHPGEALEKAVTAIRRRAETVCYRLGEAAEGEAEAVAVICPLISRALDSAERALEAAALDRTTAASMFRLAFLAIFSDWRNDPDVTLAKVKALKVWSRNRVPAILDGEKVQLKRVVDIVFTPLAFQALAPAEPKA